jgi:hypothetical protein
VPETRWQLVTTLKNNRELDGLDELVNCSVPKKALSMRANKLLFNHVLLISERDQWRRGVERLHGMGSAPLDKTFLELFRSAAVGRIRLALKPGGLEQLSHIDTNGKSAQKKAWDVRKRLLRRITSPAIRRQESELAAAPFLDGMESPPTGSGTPHW